MARIALSYRRADSSAMTGRIFDRLVDRYGDESVFMDIDNIPFGSDYRKHIRDTLSGVDVLLVVIGPNWIGRLPDGSTRLQEDSDLVRIEVEIALQRQIPVVPVLVHGGKMPEAIDLPEGLRNFAYHNAAAVDDGRDFRVHMDRLITATDAMLAHTAPPPPPRPDPKPGPEEETAPPAATEPGLWRLPLTAFVLAAVLVLGYFVIALSGTFGTVLFSFLSTLVAAIAGYVLHGRLHGLGGTAAIVGGLGGLFAMAVVWIYQIVDLRAGLPILTLDSNDSLVMPAIEYIASVMFGTIAGNLLSQLRAAGSALPIGRLGRLIPSSVGRGNPSSGWDGRRLVIALGLVAALIGAAWAGYLAWFPYCQGFMLYEFCTI